MIDEWRPNPSAREGELTRPGRICRGRTPLASMMHASARGEPGPGEELGIKDFAFCGILGEGEFGRVMMAKNVRSQDIVAVKVLRKNHLLQGGSKGVTRAITEKQACSTHDWTDLAVPYLQNWQRVP